MKSVKIKVDRFAYAENEKSWCLYTICSNNGLTWSQLKWFPKKVCRKGIGYIVCPKWLYDEIFQDTDKKPELIT